MKVIYLIGSFFLVFLLCSGLKAQVSYGASAAYGVRKINPGYSGSAIQVRRSCDNATRDIGFNSCGDLDTVMLKTFVIAANPLSATTVTSATAYSVRRLNCAYAGFAMRVRSSAAGNPTVNIGFTANGDLDTAALKTFVGSNSGFVTTWYDQSGNARHASQASNAAQPRIVNAGVIERQNGCPAVRWLGMGCSLSTAAFTTYTAAACFNAVARVSTDLTYNTIVNKTTVNYPAPLDLYNAQMVIGNGSGYNFFGYGQTFSSALPLSVWTYQAASGGSYSFYYNGSITGTGTVGFYGDNGNPLVLGSRADGVTGLNGWISECITFNVLPSATDRQFLEWSQSQYFSTGGPALSTLPIAPASGSVTAWYDQSGAGRHALQATIANQPRIINAGLLEKNNAVPAIRFGGFPQNLVAPLSTSSYPVSLSVLANTSGASTAGAFLKLGTDVNAGEGGIGIGVGNSGGTYDAAGTSVIGLKEWAAWCPSSPNVNYPSGFFTSSTIQQSGGGGTSTFVNGANIPLSNSATAVGATIAGNLFIGGYINSVNRYPVVKESEVLVFGSALSATRRVLLETNQAAYNAITITNNKYTPPAAGSYHRFVNGVGRESATDSVAGTRATVGMGISVGQTSADFLKDNGDYLTFGINCPITTTVSALNLPGGISLRWFNDWYLNKTDVNNNNGTVTVFFDFSDYGLGTLPGLASNYELLWRNSSAGTFSIVSGTTKAVSGDRVMFTVNASSLPNAYYTIGTQNSTLSPLPVEMISFDAVCRNQKVELSWIVATQSGNAYFSIERTVDGSIYETIGIIKGAGTTSERKNYSYIDDRPLSGLSYYRLKQTDLDGRETTFRNLKISCEGSNEGIKVYPNPNNGTFILEGASLYSDITVYNRMGALVFEKKNVLAKEEIRIADLPEGVYFVRVTDNSGQHALKFIIQH